MSAQSEAVSSYHLKPRLLSVFNPLGQHFDGIDKRTNKAAIQFSSCRNVFCKLMSNNMRLKLLKLSQNFRGIFEDSKKLGKQVYNEVC